ncbi:hypothetical protein B0H14DRAFT_3739579, partial [Mycena olivaceomarginata]
KSLTALYRHGRQSLSPESWRKLSYKLSPSWEPLFTSNIPLTSEQLEEIRKSALVAHTLKTSLEQEITETRMRLFRLEREEMHAAHHIERCKYPLAPIRQIPNEILAAIFVCYAEITRAPCTDVRGGVWILGHICRHWRAVVLSTPAVWSFFRARSPWGDGLNPSALAQEYLRRSGNYPLSIDFSCTHNDASPLLRVFMDLDLENGNGVEDPYENIFLIAEKSSKEIFDALLLRSPQWKVAKFDIPRSILPRIAGHHGTSPQSGQISSQRGGRMRSLSIRSGILRGELSSDFLDDLELPALERLALNCDTTGPIASLLYRSVSPLESLEFRFEDSDRSRTCIVDVLAAAPTLTSLAIYNSVRDNKRDAADMFCSLIYSPGLPFPSLLPRLKHLEMTRFEIDTSFVRMVESRVFRTHVNATDTRALLVVTGGKLEVTGLNWQKSSSENSISNRIGEKFDTAAIKLKISTPEFGPNKSRSLFGQYWMYWLNIGRILGPSIGRPIFGRIFEGGAGITSFEELFSFPHPATTWLLFRTHLSHNHLGILHTHSCPIPVSAPRVLARNWPSSTSHKQFQSGRRTPPQHASTAPNAFETSRNNFPHLRFNRVRPDGTQLQCDLMPMDDKINNELRRERVDRKKKAKREVKVLMLGPEREQQDHRAQELLPETRADAVEGRADLLARDHSTQSDLEHPHYPRPHARPPRCPRLAAPGEQQRGRRRDARDAISALVDSGALKPLNSSDSPLPSASVEVCLDFYSPVRSRGVIVSAEKVKNAAAASVLVRARARLNPVSLSDRSFGPDTETLRCCAFTKEVIYRTWPPPLAPHREHPCLYSLWCRAYPHLSRAVSILCC